MIVLSSKMEYDRYYLWAIMWLRHLLKLWKNIRFNVQYQCSKQHIKNKHYYVTRIHKIISTLHSAINEMNNKTRTMRHSLCTVRDTRSTLTLHYTVPRIIQPSIGLVRWQSIIFNIILIYLITKMLKYWEQQITQFYSLVNFNASEIWYSPRLW